MVAAKCGADVTLSDKEGNPRLQSNLEKTCEMNGIPTTIGNAKRGLEGKGGMVTKIMALSWGVFSPDLLSMGPQDIVLASDCFYDAKGIWDK